MEEGQCPHLCLDGDLYSLLPTAVPPIIKHLSELQIAKVGIMDQQISPFGQFQDTLGKRIVDVGRVSTVGKNNAVVLYAEAKTSTRMLHAGRAHHDIAADSQRLTGLFFDDFHLRRQGAIGKRQIRFKKLPRDGLFKRKTESTRSYYLEAVATAEKGFKKWQSLDMVPVRMAQQKGCPDVSGRRTAQVSTQVPDTGSGINNDALLIRSQNVNAGRVAAKSNRTRSRRRQCLLHPKIVRASVSPRS